MGNLQTSNNHNVYILGAGFSVTAGLPLMVPFLNRMRDALEVFQKQGRTSESEAIGQVLQYRLEAAAAAYWSTLDLENVEQLFSLAYAARHGVSQQLSVAMAATLDFCRERGQDRRVHVQLSDNTTAQRLRPPHGALDATWAKEAPQLFHLLEAAQVEGATTSHVAALLGMVNHRSEPTGTNTFITFNYDTLVEDALTRLNIPWTYGFPSHATSGIFRDVQFQQDPSDSWGRSSDETAIPVLKLHGSVNWSSQQVPQQPTLRELQVFKSYAALREQFRVPRLIPPTWSKSVEDHLGLPWDSAIERLRTATRVVIIGFSMPETDLHFRYLLAAGLQRNAWLRNIIFVNPDAKGVELRARSVLKNSYIDQGLIRFVPLTSDRFAAGLLGHGSIASPDINIDVGRKPETQLGFWTPAMRET